jgi:hypothetical protein
MAAAIVTLALPEERLRIKSLLNSFPRGGETKIVCLLNALGTLWRQNPQEKIVIFATYLGTVDLLAREIEKAYPGQGVVVLRGGDHGAKLAAEKRFKQREGPRVLVCTAAGREGINLQFARVLFNFDLPWNPMDIEQRIGRIHRYGQNHTAQVYNLVLSDTIEGRIFLLLNDKLLEIAKAVGKVDEQGNIAEDLRSQILGQLAERLSYERLYQEALSDPELRRTQLEVEAALSNATEARKVVFELFQDLDGFSIDDYQPFADSSAAMERLISFVSIAVREQRQRLVCVSDELYELKNEGDEAILRFTSNRDTARDQDSLALLGLDHPFIQDLLNRWRELLPNELGGVAKLETEGIVTWWLIQAYGKQNDVQSYLLPLALSLAGMRSPALRQRAESVFQCTTTQSVIDVTQRKSLLNEYIEPMLSRELQHRGISNEQGGYTSKLITWIECVKYHSQS